MLPETYSRQGIDQRNAAFCFPAELAHGYFHTLLHMEPPPEYLSQVFARGTGKPSKGGVMRQNV